MITPPLSLWRHDSWNTDTGIRQRTMSQIVTEVAHRYGITVDQLRGQRRCREIARPRHEAMHLMMEVGLFSSTQVGRFLGGRDHTTVLHGVKRHKERLMPKHVDGQYCRSDRLELDGVI